MAAGLLYIPATSNVVPHGRTSGCRGLVLRSLYGNCVYPIAGDATAADCIGSASWRPLSARSSVIAEAGRDTPYRVVHPSLALFHKGTFVARPVALLTQGSSYSYCYSGPVDAGRPLAPRCCVAKAAGSQPPAPKIPVPGVGCRALPPGGFFSLPATAPSFARRARIATPAHSDRLPCCTARGGTPRRPVHVGSAAPGRSALAEEGDGADTGGYEHGRTAQTGGSVDLEGGGPEGSGSETDGGSSSRSSSSRRVDVVLTTRDEDTIASIVTGMSHGSVAIIRISGTDAVPIVAKVFRPGGRFRFGWQPETHRVHYGTAVDGDEGLLDEVLLLPMLSPRSYTAEDVVELHCHGGGVCASRVLRAVIEAGARLAKPGEFTLRAFLNGRLDLAQAEAVSELVSARTPAAADSALAGLQGGIGGAVSELRSRCLDVLAELEARLDFDEDLPPIDVPALRRSIEEIQAGIERALRTARTGSLLRTGLQVAIVGRPNVGKSSLMNAWTNSDRAIVTDVAGTTRDVLEAGLSVGGVPITLLDTAGIRHSDDVVERIGVERSQAAAAAADIVIMVIDGAVGWTDADSDIFKALWGDGPGSAGCKVKGLALLVANKDDLRSDTSSASSASANGAGAVSPGSSSAGALDDQAQLQQQQQQADAGAGDAAEAGDPTMPLPLLARETFAAVVRTSASERRGLEALDATLLRLAGAPQLASGGVSWSVNERQAEALVRSHEALMRLSESMAADMPLDFWTIDLRAGLLALGEVSGDEVAEEVLETIFSRFCIGK